MIRAGYGVFTDRLASSIGQLFNATEWSSGGYLANTQRALPDRRADSGTVRAADGRRSRGPAAARTFLDDRTGAGERQSKASPTRSTARSTRRTVTRRACRSRRKSAPGWAVSGSYLFVGARDLIGHTGNLNAFQTGTLATGKPILGGRTYADVGALFVQTNTGTSSHHGGTFEIQKRFATATACTAATRSRSRAPTSTRSPTWRTFPKAWTRERDVGRPGRTSDIASRCR